MAKVNNSEGGSYYGEAAYWDHNYSSNSAALSFEWYLPYDDLRVALEDYLSFYDENFEILIPGCGNSELGRDLYKDGFTNVTNTDTSSAVISSMEKRDKSCDQMQYIVADSTRMDDFPDQCFDLIIDKALMDTLFCENDNLEMLEAYTNEMYRLLKPGGVFFIVSHGAPDTRSIYLERQDTYSWSIEEACIPKPAVEFSESKQEEFYYVYACQKIQE